MKNIAIYMSGSVKKGDSDERDSFWTEKHFAEISGCLSEYNVTFLNPSDRSDDLADFEGTFGRDMLQVVLADFVWVDARKRRGLGVGSEMTVAKFYGIPVLSWCPKPSHYWRNDFIFMEQKLDEWVHPFIFGLSDSIVENISNGCDWIDKVTKEESESRSKISGLERVPRAVKHYLDTQLSSDVEMSRLVKSNKNLAAKLSRWI